MFILKKGHQPGVYVPLRALFLVAYHPVLRHPLTNLILSSFCIQFCSLNNYLLTDFQDFCGTF